MIIKINGEEQSIGKETSIFGLITEKGLNPERIVVEHNHDIIPREKWSETVVKEADNIEIVSFIGGGRS